MCGILFGSSHRRRHHYHATVRGEDTYYDSYRTFPTEYVPFHMNGATRRRWREEERNIRRARREREKPIDNILSSRRAAYDEHRAKKPLRSIYSRDDLDTQSCPPVVGGYGKADYNVYQDCVSDYPKSSRSSMSHYSRSHRSASTSSNPLPLGRPRKHRAGVGSYLSCVTEYPQEEPSTYLHYRRSDGHF